MPEDVDLQHLQADIQAVSGVLAVHDLHIWTLDSSRHVISLHVVVAADSSRADQLLIKQAVKKIIREAGIGHDTLEMEFSDDEKEAEHKRSKKQKYVYLLSSHQNRI